MIDKDFTLLAQEMAFGIFQKPRRKCSHKWDKPHHIETSNPMVRRGWFTVCTKCEKKVEAEVEVETKIIKWKPLYFTKKQCLNRKHPHNRRGRYTHGFKCTDCERWISEESPEYYLHEDMSYRIIEELHKNGIYIKGLFDDQFENREEAEEFFEGWYSCLEEK